MAFWSRLNPENTEGTVSILQPSGQILQPTAKSGLKQVGHAETAEKTPGVKF